MRHIVNLSGGKDSSAMAIYLNDREYWRSHFGKTGLQPVEPRKFEYVFCDTDKELPETYEWLEKLENYLQQPIIRLNNGKGFDYWLAKFGNFLPSFRARWCTSQLKIKPFEEYVGDDVVSSYVGLRADENREGYALSDKKHVTPVYPFKEDGIVENDVLKILTDSGLGYPSYYKWRTRSGCYFCFFQRKIEWVGLLENHPELFEKAKGYEESKQSLLERKAREKAEKEELEERVKENIDVLVAKGIITQESLDRERLQKERQQAQIQQTVDQFQLTPYSLEEKQTEKKERGYTWIQGESLEELSQPERLYQIKRKHERKLEILEQRERQKVFKAAQRSLFELIPDQWLQDDDYDEQICLACE